MIYTFPKFSLEPMNTITKQNFESILYIKAKIHHINLQQLLVISNQCIKQKCFLTWRRFRSLRPILISVTMVTFIFKWTIREDTLGVAESANFTIKYSVDARKQLAMLEFVCLSDIYFPLRIGPILHFSEFPVFFRFLVLMALEQNSQ